MEFGKITCTCNDVVLTGQTGPGFLGEVWFGLGTGLGWIEGGIANGRSVSWSGINEGGGWGGESALDTCMYSIPGLGEAFGSRNAQWVVYLISILQLVVGRAIDQ